MALKNGLLFPQGCGEPLIQHAATHRRESCIDHIDQRAFTPTFPLCAKQFQAGAGCAVEHQMPIGVHSLDAQDVLACTALRGFDIVHQRPCCWDGGGIVFDAKAFEGRYAEVLPERSQCCVAFKAPWISRTQAWP